MKKYLILLMFAAIMSIPAICIAEVHTQRISPVSLVKPYKDINYRILVLNKLKKQAQNLSDGDKSVIDKYVYGAVKGEDSFMLMNGYLRNNLNQYIKPKDITKPLQMRMEYYADNLCKTLTKTELPQNMLLYRGVDNKELSAIFNDKNVLNILKQNATETNVSTLSSKLNGTKITDKGFIITYYDKDCVTNTNVLFEIKAPKNLQGVLLTKQDKKYEKALILNKGTQWKICNVSLYYDKNSKKNIYKICLKYFI